MTSEVMEKEARDKAFLRITSFTSIFAGIVGKIICHPIDTIRAKL